MQEHREVASMCNSSEKLNPPTFVTVPYETDKNLNLRNLAPNRTYKQQLQKVVKMCVLLRKEVMLLEGFIERKGTQLRLEKAMLLTVQVFKISNRWIDNEFLKNMTTMDSAMDPLHTYLKKKIVAEFDSVRLPSRQWIHWIIYLCLRDICLLSKIKLQCEKAAVYWLGLISAFHHWRDSLVVNAMLARIRHLSNSIVERLLNSIYPYLRTLSTHLKSNNAGDWPCAKFTPPENVIEWMSVHMNIQFTPSMHTETTNVRKIESSSFLSNPSEMEEDIGQEVDLGSSSDFDSEKEKLKWSKFFKNYQTKVKTSKGREILCKRIKRRLRESKSSVVSKKLKRLKKLIEMQEKQYGRKRGVKITKCYEQLESLVTA